MGGEVVGRQTPHEGLSVAQLLSALQNLGFSPERVPLPRTREDSVRSETSSLPSTFARYANSGIPTIAYNRSHSWLVIGYYFAGPPEVKDHDTPNKQLQTSNHDATCLVVHDDVQAPTSNLWAATTTSIRGRTSTMSVLDGEQPFRRCPVRCTSLPNAPSGWVENG